jgi:hypothetical protein
MPTANTSSNQSSKSKIIAAVFFLSTLVAGLAAFKENISKLFSSREREKVIFRIELPTSTDTSISHHGELDFIPTDPGLTVQGLQISYPPALKLTPLSYDGHQVDILSELGRIDVYLATLGGEYQKNPRKAIDDKRICKAAIPILVKADFIGKDSDRHTTNALYFLRVYSSESHLPEKTVVGDSVAPSITFEREVSDDATAVGLNLDSYINPSTVQCYWDSDQAANK